MILWASSVSRIFYTEELSGCASNDPPWTRQASYAETDTQRENLRPDRSLHWSNLLVWKPDSKRSGHLPDPKLLILFTIFGKPRTNGNDSWSSLKEQGFYSSSPPFQSFQSFSSSPPRVELESLGSLAQNDWGRAQLLPKMNRMHIIECG